MKTVKVIRATAKQRSKRQRVSAYIRVSHSSLEQSFSTQLSVYKELIQNRGDWEFAGIYSDFAISGKTQKEREGFQDLLNSCRLGQIDLILTKSISRFGRNTVELLETIRELKNLGISVYFEKEGIDTMTAEGELLLTLLASVAQEESESIRQNIGWRVKESFEQGKPYRPQDIYGYRWNGETYLIEPHEADIVRQVFDWYMEGLSAPKIAKRLDDIGERTRLGNRFTKRVIYSFFEQEAYYGRLVLQKTYRPPFGSRSVPNRGQKTKYIVDNAHEPIVSKAYFQAVNEEKTKRAKRRPSIHEGVGQLKGKVYCRHCGVDMVYSIEKRSRPHDVRYACRHRQASKADRCVGLSITERVILESIFPIVPEEVSRIDVDTLEDSLTLILSNGSTKTKKIRRRR